MYDQLCSMKVGLLEEMDLGMRRPEVMERSGWGNWWEQDRIRSQGKSRTEHIPPGVRASSGSSSPGSVSQKRSGKALDTHVLKISEEVY